MEEFSAPDVNLSLLVAIFVEFVSGKLNLKLTLEHLLRDGSSNSGRCINDWEAHGMDVLEITTNMFDTGSRASVILCNVSCDIIALNKCIPALKKHQEKK